MIFKIRSSNKSKVNKRSNKFLTYNQIIIIESDKNQ